MIKLSFFIPIRKGSKRVKNKNLRPLPGFRKGLTEIKINHLNKFRKLIKNKFFKEKEIEYIVSTNCEKTINYLKLFPWIKIHIRKDFEATDDSLDKLISIIPNICQGKFILWTHVTSPFFDGSNYFNFIKVFLKKKNINSAFSSDVVQKFLYSKKKGWISHDFKRKKWPRTQDLEKLYIANSAAFIAKKKIYKINKDRLCKNPFPIISGPGSGVDIDDYVDFKNLRLKLQSQIKIL